MKTPVLNIAPGKTVDYHGEPCLVLEHRKDGTLMLHLDQMLQQLCRQLSPVPSQWPLSAEPHGRQPR